MLSDSVSDVILTVNKADHTQRIVSDGRARTSSATDRAHDRRLTRAHHRRRRQGVNVAPRPERDGSRCGQAAGQSGSCVENGGVPGGGYRTLRGAGEGEAEQAVSDLRLEPVSDRMVDDQPRAEHAGDSGAGRLPDGGDVTSTWAIALAAV